MARFRILTGTEIRISAIECEFNLAFLCFM